MNKKHIIALLCLIFFLVGGIVYYTRTPDAVTVDKKTNIRTAHLDRIYELNKKAGTYYYKLEYEWVLIIRLIRDGKETFVEREMKENRFTAKPGLITSDLDIQTERDLIEASVIIQTGTKADVVIKKDSFKITSAIAQYCDLTFAEAIMACYQEGKDVPQLVSKDVKIIPLSNQQ